jgi:hypothetical protein
MYENRGGKNMKKERQIGIRVGLPAFFALEVEDVYRHTSGAHRALAFPDFLGLLIGLGLEAYRKGNPPEGKQPVAPGHDHNAAEPYKADFWDFPDNAPVPRGMLSGLRKYHADREQAP